MFRTTIQTSTRTLRSVRFYADKPISESVKDAAKSFKAEGSVGSKFTSKGEVGKSVDENVGGPFSKDGAIGRQFEKDGAVGGTGQKVAEKAEEAAKKA